MVSTMLVSNEVISIIGAIGLLSLAISWHRRNSSSVWLAQIGWVFVGLFFFNDASLYYAHDDLILTLFSVMALPMAGGMALWEHKADDERTRSSDLKGGMAANIWHTTGKLYGYNLRKGYIIGEDPVLDIVLEDFDISHSRK